MTDEASGAALRRRLDAGCAIMEVLLDRSVDRTCSAAARREAVSLIEEHALATAVAPLAPNRPAMRNTAWRALFGELPDGMPAELAAFVAERGAASRHANELPGELAGRPAVFAASTRRLRERGRAARGVVICVDITDTVIARELAVGAGALVWSGPIGKPADYTNGVALAYFGHVIDDGVYHPDDRDRVDAARDAERDTEVEAHLRRADGTYRVHRIRFSRSVDGARWFGIGVEEPDRANRLKDQFLAVVSHELRAPLTTMLLWEKVLREDQTSPELRERALDAIRQSALGQSRLVADLLDISRAISGKLYVDLRRVDLARILGGALEAIAPQAAAKQVAIQRSGVLLGEVEADVVRLRQVFDNLLANAVKFTPPGGRVDVDVVRRGRSIAISIADTGCGMAPEFLPEIFRAFSQTEGILTRRSGGLGLGLAIARQLVELHHGTLVAASEGEGRGATLTLTLPIARARHARTPAEGVASVPTLAGKHILIVDDDRRVREALTVLMERSGAVVNSAESATAARARIAASVPDAIVCDLAMPIEDGYTFIRRLRASAAPGSDVPAVALTAYATEIDAKHALDAGFDRHLAKPIEFEQLVWTLDELMRESRNDAPH